MKRLNAVSKHIVREIKDLGEIYRFVNGPDIKNEALDTNHTEKHGGETFGTVLEMNVQRGNTPSLYILTILEKKVKSNLVCLTRPFITPGTAEALLCTEPR